MTARGQGPGAGVRGWAQRTSWLGRFRRQELAAIALESSQAERRADDAERELMEWKKIKFMQDRVGEDFQGDCAELHEVWIFCGAG